MKMLHVSTASSWRGGEQQIAYLIEELKVNVVLQIICCPANSPLELYCRNKPVGIASFNSRGFLDLGLALKIKNICKKEDISIIHAHDSHAHSATVLAAAIFKNNVPVVISRRVDFKVSPNPLSRWKYNHSSIDNILCVSEKIKAVTGADIRDPGKLSVVYDGIDLGKFSAKKNSLLHQEFGLAITHPLVGNASALADHKDYFTFVDTAEIVLKKIPAVRFVIIGSGPEKSRIENYILSKGLDRHIFLTGFRENIHALLPELDVFLMTSVTEGLGSIVLDAFAARVSVVSTTAGGIPEIVSHGQTGLTAPVKDAEQLAANVCLLLEDKNISDKIKQNALHFVQDFSKEKMALRTLEVYRNILNANSLAG